MKKINLQRIFETPNDAHYFFGYFNTPQVSMNDTKILALKCDFIDHVPDSTDSAIVGYFDLNDARPVFREIGKTTTFNWQQGCMLQFCGPDYTSTIIYNNFDGEKFVSELINLETGARKTIDSAIYAMFPCGEYALSLDFARHYWCRRGYSYGNIVDEKKNRAVAEDDGIWLLNLKTGVSEKIISLEKMMDISPVSTMQGATHYLEHMTINPSGNKFAFLHRWRFPEGGIHSRLCVANRQGTDIRVINDSARMSHYCWRDEDRLIGYGGIANPINRLRKKKALLKSVFRYLLPLYHRFVKDNSSMAIFLTGDSYLDIDTKNGRITSIASTLPKEDGHPTMLAKRNIFITDTYARSVLGQKAKLFAFDLESNHETLLDELRSIDKYDESPLRCDLHPRGSISNNIITIDTMDRGVRGIYAYKLL